MWLPNHPAVHAVGIAVLVSCSRGAVVRDEDPLPRRVFVDGQRFVLAATGMPIVLSGPNVVVKGPPYLPEVAGDTVCADVIDHECRQSGTCSSCTTFNAADATHIKAMGWNAIRLSVVWAGAQSRDENALDPDFVRRLVAVLSLCDQVGLYVVLDNHADQVGTANCGNGVPLWFQRRAAPELIGTPLQAAMPWGLMHALDVRKMSAYSDCGDNVTRWAQHAYSPNYNLLNECCQGLNVVKSQNHGRSSNPVQLGLTTMAQRTMDYLLRDGAGRQAFVRYWRLLAAAVRRHPSAVACELLNEPVSVRRKEMFETWRAAAEAINSEVPDMAVRYTPILCRGWITHANLPSLVHSLLVRPMDAHGAARLCPQVSVADTMEATIIPAWLSKVLGSRGAGLELDEALVKWLQTSSTLFYSWHYYSPLPPLYFNLGDAIRNAQGISSKWDMPSFVTESGSNACRAADAANISHTYWHYSAYCTTGPAFGNRTVPNATFGACILGWAGANSSADC